MPNKWISNPKWCKNKTCFQEPLKNNTLCERCKGNEATTQRQLEAKAEAEITKCIQTLEVLLGGTYER